MYDANVEVQNIWCVKTLELSYTYRFIVYDCSDEYKVRIKNILKTTSHMDHRITKSSASAAALKEPDEFLRWTPDEVMLGQAVAPSANKQNYYFNKSNKKMQSSEVKNHAYS